MDAFKTNHWIFYKNLSIVAQTDKLCDRTIYLLQDNYTHWLPETKSEQSICTQKKSTQQSQNITYLSVYL